MEQASVFGHSYTLATGVTVNHGEFACLAAGVATAATVGTGLRCVGVFDLKQGISVTGDGTLKVRIVFPKSGEVWPANNDTTDPVTVDGSTAYLVDGVTVSSHSSGTSIAGTVVGFRGDGKVFVKVTGF